MSVRVIDYNGVSRTVDLTKRRLNRYLKGLNIKVKKKERRVIPLESSIELAFAVIDSLSVVETLGVYAIENSIFSSFGLNN